MARQNDLNFKEKIYNALMKIPSGCVSTYGGLARMIDKPNAARAVGQVLNKNQHLIKIPCHRVVKSDGSIGGYKEGTRKKIELLRAEGVIIKNGRIENFEEVLFVF